MADKLFPTTVIGSYPQPTWLVNDDVLRARTAAGVKRDSMWLVDEPYLDQALDDATRLAIRDMELAGIDVITDGEIRRHHSFSLIAGVEGLDSKNLTSVQRGPFTMEVPRITGPIRHAGSKEARDLQFLKANTDRPVKVTLPGPFTMALGLANEYYADDEELTMACAEYLNAEARALDAVGADVVQFDEPWLRHDVAAAERYAVKALDRAVEGLKATSAVHLCFGYAQFVGTEKPAHYSFLGQLSQSKVEQVSVEAAQPHLNLDDIAALASKTVVLGVLDLSTPEVETPETVAARIRAALAYVPPEHLVPAPDCGMKYLSRDAAFGKLKALSAGAALLRRELQGGE